MDIDPQVTFRLAENETAVVVVIFDDAIVNAATVSMVGGALIDATSRADGILTMSIDSDALDALSRVRGVHSVTLDSEFRTL